jgi:hypothetical protein
MLRHISKHREYWFCRNCWQEMPDLEKLAEKRYLQSNRIVNLSISSKVLVPSADLLKNLETSREQLKKLSSKKYLNTTCKH